MVANSAYIQNMDVSQDDLVLQNAELVKRIAYHLVSRLAGNVDVDDLIQAGMIGLLEASRKYDASRGANFQTFAGIRIRGAMLDEVRRSDWTPRSVYQKLRKVTEAVRAVEMRHGRNAREIEVAEELDLTIDEYHKVLRDATTCRLFSLEQTQGEGSHTQPSGEIEPGPQESAANAEFRTALAEAIEKLPEREGLVLSLYYDEELNLREIGEVLGVSESRISQIHSKAVIRLRARLGEWTS